MDAGDSETPASDGDVRPEKKVTEGNRLHKIPTILGTMVHRLMEVAVSSHNCMAPEDMVNEIIKEYLQPSYGSFEEDLRTALKKVYETITAGGLQAGK